MAPIKYNIGFPNLADAMSTFFPVINCQLNQLTTHSVTKANESTKGIDSLCLAHQLEEVSTICRTKYPVIIIAVAKGTRLAHHG